MKELIVVLISSYVIIVCEAFSFPSKRLIHNNNNVDNRYSGKTLLHMEDDSAPSDYDADDLVETERHATLDEDEDDAIIRDELKRELLLLASVTNRGEYATSDETNIIIDMVTQLEVRTYVTSTSSSSSPFFQKLPPKKES